MGIVSSAVGKFRTTLLIMLFCIIAGVLGRTSMPIASNPNVTFPWVNIAVFLEGASPEDMARLVAKPLENRMLRLEGQEEVFSVNSQSFTYVRIKYDVDYDIDQAVLDVERAVSEVRNQLPPEAEDPRVMEFADNDQPILVYSVYGFANLRSGFVIAKDIQERLEKIPGILEIKIDGVPEELLEVVVSRPKLESLGVGLLEIGNAVRSNNVLIPAGFQDTGSGKFAVEIPSVFESREDVFNLPIKSSGSKVVTLGDVADIKRTFKDPTSFSRVNGFDAITLSIQKRVGFNELDIANTVKNEIEEIRAEYPSTLKIEPGLDTTQFASDMVSELEGNIITAVVLVMVLVVATLGLRNGLIVGIAIPFSFLVTFGVLYYILGYEFNFLVMFGMLLGLGMLIDGGIVIVEYADKLIDQGQDRREAYVNSAKRMFTPVVASILTTVAAFTPLMVWPGMSGKFMRYLPITVFVVLMASLAYALIFAPVIGSLFGRQKRKSDLQNDSDDTFIKKNYKSAIGFAVKNPLETIFYTLFLVLFVIPLGIVGNYGKGFVYFPSIDPWIINVNLQARGNISPYEAKDMAVEVEDKLIGLKGVEDLLITVQNSGWGGGDGVARGYILVEDPKTLDISGWDVLNNAREAVANPAGYKVNVREVQEGPGQWTAPVEIKLLSESRELIDQKTVLLRNYIEENVDGLTGLADTMPKYKIEWKIDVDKERAYQAGINLFDVGSAVQMVTGGIKLGEYRPDDAKEEIDIRARFPSGERTLSSLDLITVNTRNGPIPVSSFVEVDARQNAASLNKIDGKFYHEISGINKPGYNLYEEINQIKNWMKETGFEDPRMEVRFGGLTQQGDEATSFLILAFVGALFLMFIILVTQFNSISQPFIILVSVLFSTAGVFLGLTIAQVSPSTIMTGTALVGLAGIVVNNNIVLIDTYNRLKVQKPESSIQDLITETCLSRLRPVLLTTITTIFGLIFLAFGYSVDLVNQVIYEGTSTVKWYQAFGISICWGLGFSTILTLLVTPAFLTVVENVSEKINSRRLSNSI
ncbi:MAG: efflux RND transporter permease subunit [Gammaproteobacteria bacterium]|tara:strand:+ start:2768 stop:5884 length:3117 start_codon:yes stop_codon:yes gene_type:complete